MQKAEYRKRNDAQAASIVLHSEFFALLFRSASRSFPPVADAQRRAIDLQAQVTQRVGRQPRGTSPVEEGRRPVARELL